ncbi:MAG: hypothetical protein LJE87_09510 [Deltaproteobacteria bacterium]|nr:hypothetical protein [Deltaproteobacteria bacterium]
MTSLDPDEIKRVKLHGVKCSQCKADLMIRPTQKVCPVCGSKLPIPGKYRLTLNILCQLKNQVSVN